MFFPGTSGKYIASSFSFSLILSCSRIVNTAPGTNIKPQKTRILLTLLLSISVKVSPPPQTCVSVEWRNRRSAVQLWYQRCESCPEIGKIGEWGMFQLKSTKGGQPMNWCRTFGHKTLPENQNVENRILTWVLEKVYSADSARKTRWVIHYGR